MPAKTNKKKAAPVATLGGTDAANDDDVNKIRDIIFGAQMREYAERFERMENRFADEVRRLLDESEQRYRKLNDVLAARFDQIASQLDKERLLRNGDTDDLRKELKQIRNDIIAQFGDAGDRLDTEVDRLSGLVENTEAALQAAHKELQDSIARQLKALRSEKTESAELSTLFGELAARLSRKDES